MVTSFDKTSHRQNPRNLMKFVEILIFSEDNKREIQPINSLMIRLLLLMKFCMIISKHLHALE